MKRQPISAKLRFDVLKRDNFTCKYCGRNSSDVKLHVDHIVPVSDGGSNDFANLCASCSDCNLGKGATPTVAREEFCRLLTDEKRIEFLAVSIVRRWPTTKIVYARELIADACVCGVEWEVLVELCATSASWWTLSKAVLFISGSYLDPFVATGLIRGQLLGDWPPDLEILTESHPTPASEPDYLEGAAQLGRDFLARLAARNGVS